MDETNEGSGGLLRAHQLDKHPRYRVLSRTTWQDALASGVLKSTKIGRARIVRVEDVEAFLRGVAGASATA